MAIILYKDSFINGAAARHVKTQRTLDAVTAEVHTRAEENLASVRATTPHVKISGRKHQTKISSGVAHGKYGPIDREVAMTGSGVLALEFGHGPSGYFAEERYGKPTMAPQGLYILTRAAWRAGSNVVASIGRKVGKRL